MSFSSLASDERIVIGELLDHILANGFLISVYDGEEYSVKVSRDREFINANIGATDETTLVLRDPGSRDEDGRAPRVGSIYLIHGNGRDVISDHTDNQVIAALVAPALRAAEALL